MDTGDRKPPPSYFNPAQTDETDVKKHAEKSLADLKEVFDKANQTPKHPSDAIDIHADKNQERVEADPVLDAADPDPEALKRKKAREELLNKKDDPSSKTRKPH